MISTPAPGTERILASTRCRLGPGCEAPHHDYTHIAIAYTSQLTTVILCCSVLDDAGFHCIVSYCFANWVVSNR